MPELPEVESYARALDAGYAGKVLRTIRFHRDDIRFSLDKNLLSRLFREGVRLRRVYRDGKYLILETDSGEVEVSLGMTGAFVAATPERPAKHEHLTLIFKSGEALGFVDPRRFGFWRAREADKTKATVDVLDVKALERLFESGRLCAAKRPVKALLMDQACFAGMGNIYALEALFRAGIRPDRSCTTLKKSEWTALARAIPKLLCEAIAAGGSSVATYRRLNGDEGAFQKVHQVYDRDGERCLRRGCGGVIARIKQSGRSSWFCPVCQK